MARVEKVLPIPGRARATGLSLLSWVLFASSGPLAVAVMVVGWNPAAVSFVRIGTAAVLLALVVAVWRPWALRFTRDDVWLLLGYGVLGVAGVQLLFFVAVSRVPVGVAMVLVNAAPALVALWVRVVRGIRLPGQVWLGVGLAPVGLALIAQSWHGARPDPVGIAAGLGAAVCSAGFFLLGEHGARRHDPFGMTAAGLLLGAMVMAVVATPWTLPLDLLPAVAVLGGLQFPVWLVLLVLAVAGTALPYLAGLWALRELPAPLAGALGLLEPLVAAALAWMLLGQALRPAQLAGAALLLLCAVLVQRAMP